MTVLRALFVGSVSATALEDSLSTFISARTSAMLLMRRDTLADRRSDWRMTPCSRLLFCAPQPATASFQQASKGAA